MARQGLVQFVMPLALTYLRSSQPPQEVNFQLVRFHLVLLMFSHDEEKINAGYIKNLKI